MSRMMKTVVMTAAMATTVAAAMTAADETKDKKPVPAVLNFTMSSLDGKAVDLSKYQGNVVLIVNTASECGYTPQYQQLEWLHEKYAEKGLTILGFPANDFGTQEPGTDSDIKEFCTKKYGVKFEMFSKVSVVAGEKQCPLYKHLTSVETNPKFAGEVKWNFEKFLISRDGEIVNRFRSKVKPDSEEMVKAIEAELETKAKSDGKA